MISIILPTRNEPLINELVTELHKTIKQKHEIIIIDKSDIPPKVKGARLYPQQTKGLGNAILEGVKYATGEKIVVMDADFSHDPKDVPLLLKKLDEADFVIGSRYCVGAKTEDVGKRYGIFPNSLISMLYCTLASRLLHLGIKDPMNGFAAAHKRVYDSLSLDPLGYKIHMETAFKARRKGFMITEVPTTFHKRRAGKSNTGMHEAFRTLRFILELRFGLR